MFLWQQRRRQLEMQKKNFFWAVILFSKYEKYGNIAWIEKKSMLQRKSISLDFDVSRNKFADEHTPTEWHRPNNSDTSLSRGPINDLNKNQYYNHPSVFPEVFTLGPEEIPKIHGYSSPLSLHGK